MPKFLAGRAQSQKNMIISHGRGEDYLSEEGGQPTDYWFLRSSPSTRYLIREREGTIRSDKSSSRDILVYIIHFAYINTKPQRLKDYT